MQSVLKFGGGGIRTLETLAGLTVFKTVLFDRSSTPPVSVENIAFLASRQCLKTPFPFCRARARAQTRAH